MALMPSRVAAGFDASSPCVSLTVMSDIPNFSRVTQVFFVRDATLIPKLCQH
jgi:hypothetical protein